MNIFWAVLIILVVMLLVFVVLPSMFETPVQATTVTTKLRVPMDQPAVAESPEEIKKRELDRLEAIEKKHSDELLQSYYHSANPAVPIDYTIKPIGECPESRQMSRDIPLANVPMCKAKRDDNMFLA